MSHWQLNKKERLNFKTSDWKVQKGYFLWNRNLHLLMILITLPISVSITPTTDGEVTIILAEFQVVSLNVLYMPFTY